MNTLQCTIDRFEEEKAVCVFADGSQLIISKDKLPDNCREGESIYLVISKDLTALAKEQQLAKNILKEILNQNSNEA